MKISIITASFNQGEFIERTINSVLSQVSQQVDLEYIIVDNNSIDQTSNILKRYQHQCRIFVEADTGQANAINKGLKLATGDIIAWLNSDDVYHEHTLKTVVDVFAQHPEIDVIYGKAFHIDEHDRFLENYPTFPWSKQLLTLTCFLSQPATFIRRRIIERFGLLNEDLHYCMDYEYWLRLAMSNAVFFYLPKPLASTRLHSNAKTTKDKLPSLNENIAMLKQTINNVPYTWQITKALRSLEGSKRMLFHPWLMMKYIFLQLRRFMARHG